MILLVLLKCPLSYCELNLGKIATDIASHAQTVHECELFRYGYRLNCTAHFTTLALFVKQMFLDYFKNGRKKYTVSEVVDMADEIATLSGCGRNKETPLYWNSRIAYYWGWAFAKALARVSKRSEDMANARNLWRRCEDGSAHSYDDYWSARWFLLETSDIHDSWSSKDCGVVEKWYSKEDEDWHYFPYKVFPTEHEARLFIAELVMKINSPWYPYLEKAIPDIVDEMAEVYVNEQKPIDEECKRREDEEVSAGTKKTTHVYIMNFRDGIQKIGFSTNPISRTRTKENESGRIAIDVCATDILPESEARRIEAKCHYDLADYRVGSSEFFTCTNEQARAVLAKYSPITFHKNFE